MQQRCSINTFLKKKITKKIRSLLTPPSQERNLPLRRYINEVAVEGCSCVLQKGKRAAKKNTAEKEWQRPIPKQHISITEDKDGIVPALPDLITHVLKVSVLHKHCKRNILPILRNQMMQLLLSRFSSLQDDDHQSLPLTLFLVNGRK